MFSFPRRRVDTQSTQRQKPNLKSEREILTFREREVQVLRRAYKRSIGVTLQVNGRIRVSAPKTTPLSRIEAFLDAHSQWIETHLAKYQSLRDSYPPKRYVFGETFLLLGNRIPLAFECGTQNKARFDVRFGQLVCEIPPNRWPSFDPEKGHPELGGALIEFYARTAREIITERLVMYSARMGLRPSAICFRSQKTRWGSCSSRGKISLNWRLLIAPIEVIDYVVVHELAHLRHYDHSPEFWALVGTQIPRYRSLRQWLREHQYEADFLAKRSELHY